MNKFTRIYFELINKNSKNIYARSWGKWIHFPNVFNTNVLKDLFCNETS